MIMKSQRPTEAKRWLSWAAREGSADSMFALAHMLEDSDPAAAEHWYRRAAEAGHSGVAAASGSIPG
jgi:hypothetical protein